MNIVNLTVHKNNRQQRERKINRKTLIRAARDMANSECVAGFFIVSWDEDGKNYENRYYDPKAVKGMSALPDYVAGCERRLVTSIDCEE